MNYLGPKSEKVDDVAKELNQLLADYHVYYQNLRNFHWNVKGMNFFDLHEQFEELYNDARLKIDELAERVLTLRRRPMSTLSEYLDSSNVEESDRKTMDYDMVKHILKDHKVIIKQMRTVLNTADDAGDEGTIDMVGGFLAELEKSSWMLDAWTEQKFTQRVPEDKSATLAG